MTFIPFVKPVLLLQGKRKHDRVIGKHFSLFNFMVCVHLSPLNDGQDAITLGSESRFAGSFTSLSDHSFIRVHLVLGQALDVQS